jgi:hypothetical protein
MNPLALGSNPPGGILPPLLSPLNELARLSDPLVTHGQIWYVHRNRGLHL